MASWLSAANTLATSAALGRNRFVRNRQPYRSNCPIAAPTAAPEFRKAKRALIAAQNVPTGAARSSFHIPLPLNADRVFQQYRRVPSSPRYALLTDRRTGLAT